jgi:hypothetical protein
MPFNRFVIISKKDYSFTNKMIVNKIDLLLFFENHIKDGKVNGKVPGKIL